MILLLFINDICEVGDQSLINFSVLLFYFVFYFAKDQLSKLMTGQMPGELKEFLDEVN